MIISEQWLREWIDPPLSTDELAAQLTMAGLEVDAVTPVAGEFSGVVVAEIVTAMRSGSLAASSAGVALLIVVWTCFAAASGRAAH